MIEGASVVRTHRNVSSRISVVVPSGDRQPYVKLGLEDPL